MDFHIGCTILFYISTSNVLGFPLPILQTTNRSSIQSNPKHKMVRNGHVLTAHRPLVCKTSLWQEYAKTDFTSPSPQPPPPLIILPGTEPDPGKYNSLQNEKRFWSRKVREIWGRISTVGSHCHLGTELIRENEKYAKTISKKRKPACTTQREADVIK